MAAVKVGVSCSFRREGVRVRTDALSWSSAVGALVPNVNGGWRLMQDGLPLKRFPLVAGSDPYALSDQLNRTIGGERRCLRASPGPGRYEFNLLRLGPCAVISCAVEESVIRAWDDAGAVIYICGNGSFELIQGRTGYAVGRRHVFCGLPGAERTIQFGGTYRGLGIRIGQNDLAAAMYLYGHDNADLWSHLLAVADIESPAVARFVGHVRDIIEIYDAGANFPDRRLDDIFGRSIIHSAARMVAAVTRIQGAVDGPSLDVARAARDIIAERYARPLSLSTIAEVLGRSIPCVHDSLVLHTGLMPMEFLMLTRLVAAEEFLKRSYNDPKDVAKACGFISHEAYVSAVFRREELRSRLKDKEALAPHAAPALG